MPRVAGDGKAGRRAAAFEMLGELVGIDGVDALLGRHDGAERHIEVLEADVLVGRLHSEARERVKRVPRRDIALLIIFKND